MRETMSAGLVFLALATVSLVSAAPFTGRFFVGMGDADTLQLLDTSARMLYPSPDLQNIGMLYNASWNGFVEGPTWGAWWIQNSYGPSYCGLPFFVEPYATFLANAQDLWFSQMGDGQREGGGKWHWVPPDGCLCDAAAPGWIYYKQGDGRVDIHDWGMEFTAAGLLLQAEQLLISRDPEAIAHYLPMLERCAGFVESRRDPKNNCFLAGPAGNLLAPSYAGYKQPDGTYGQAYLTGLSVTYIAALDRLIELEKLAGHADQAALYTQRRATARQGLQHLTTPEGTLIKSLDPDGTKHGVYGAEKYGYFEAVCNHDAIAFRVVDEAQARRIYDQMAAIPGLRPHDLIITNYPSLDDMYEEPRGLWGFGTWVNGGHWTTCEARMILAYFRLGKYDDAKRAMAQLLRFARDFRFDNPLVQFGNAVYQPKEPINCVYDSWGGPLAMLRGLFEYLYTADSLTLIPHVPTGVTALDQRFPVRFGDKRLFLSTRGAGPVTAVYVNRQPCRTFDKTTVTLPYARLPQRAQITICLGGAKPQFAELPAEKPLPVPAADDELWDVSRWWQNPLGNGRPVRIGADSNGRCLFVGDMRRARVWQRALSEAEIAALAADVKAEVADGLVFDFFFDRATDGTCPNPPNPDLLARPVGEVAIVDSEGGKVARFDGKGFLEIPCDPRLTLTEAYTLATWIKPGELPDTGARLIDRVTAGVDDAYLFDTCPKDSLRLITERGHLGYAAKLAPGQWAHVAATFDAQAGLRMYLNGKLVASAPCQAIPRGNQYAQVGAFLRKLRAAGLGDTAEAKHAELIVMHLQALRERLRLEEAGELPALPPASQLAADRSYIQAADRLNEGLRRVLKGYEKAEDARDRRVWALWQETLAP